MFMGQYVAIYTDIVYAVLSITNALYALLFCEYFKLGCRVSIANLLALSGLPF